MTNIILCGGSGTRLWPISRTLMPKQFVKLFDSSSLFQLTVERNSGVCDKHFIVSNAEQYFLAGDQLAELGQNSSRYLLEPIGRNTAPAIALACMDLAEDEVVLISPSDHLIKKQNAYEKVLQEAKALAEEGSLVTFGIRPEYAETGYGYIEANGSDVKAFHEKPDKPTAKSYLKAGNYYWNSGMFCFKAGVFLDELKKHSPKIYERAQKAYENAKTDNSLFTPHPSPITNHHLRIKHEDMAAIPEDSIDYAVMEKSDRVKVVPSDIGWSDLGSFESLYDQLPKDENGNTQNDHHISCESKNNLIYGTERTIATIGLEDSIVVDTGDALLVAKQGSGQKVKQIVKQLTTDNSPLTNLHLTAHRPWGTYTVLEDTPGYKIKRIEVKPGKRLSLQKHFHRNEHWIVVSGTATVTVGEETKLIRPNESTYIKMGEVHRLENRGKIPVIMIEAQVGEYTGEDDIVRLDDDYSREK